MNMYNFDFRFLSNEKRKNSIDFKLYIYDNCNYTYTVRWSRWRLKGIIRVVVRKNEMRNIFQRFYILYANVFLYIIHQLRVYSVRYNFSTRKLITACRVWPSYTVSPHPTPPPPCVRKCLQCDIFTCPQRNARRLIVSRSHVVSAAPEVYGRSLCNHRRAYKFFTDSVSPGCAFPAVPCESYEKFLEGECFPCKDKSKCGNMGYHSDKSPARGKMYLLTRDEEPFCGKYIIL